MREERASSARGKETEGAPPASHAAARGPVERATVHLQVFGQEHALSFDVPVGPTAVGAFLEPARALSAGVAAIVLADVEALGKRPTCGPRCSACCRQMVPVSVVEARALAELVAAMPNARRRSVEARFDAALRRLEAAGLLDPARPRGRAALLGRPSPGKSAWRDAVERYFALGIPCPFLEDDSCSIHPDRPLVCREYLVTSAAEHCTTQSPELEMVPRPLHMGEVLGDAAARLHGLEVGTIPLVLALEWSAVHGAKLDAELDGETIYWTLVELLDNEGRKPFEERD